MFCCPNLYLKYGIFIKIRKILERKIYFTNKDFKISDTLPEEASECAGCCGSVSGSKTGWPNVFYWTRKKPPKEEGFIVGVYFSFNILNIFINSFNNVQNKILFTINWSSFTRDQQI